ncbi:hypothetical protein [Kitasatospora griseola]|uniref:hypothetical protein n=1 Tax=Kitasatospora griseola TaxID=2064 RepID=UPI003829712A
MTATDAAPDPVAAERRWQDLPDRIHDLEARVAATTSTTTTPRQTIADSLVLTDPVTEVIRAAIRRVARLGATHQAELTAMRQIGTNLRAANGTPRFGLADYEEETYEGRESCSVVVRKRAASATSTPGSRRSPARVPSTRWSPTFMSIARSMPTATRTPSPTSSSPLSGAAEEMPQNETGRLDTG